MIATIAAIAEKKKRKKKFAIAAMIWKPLFSDRSDNDEKEKVLSQRLLLLRSLESGFHMIAMIPAIAELFFFSAIVGIIWKPDLTLNT